ncbi:response regulator [Rhodospirillaceae bacterium KN72]|uniref:Response regulator n=1 Tax=Pacificispira spongiicola TaxID=2729598 RepID=A0A7Y0HI20_9PROT|nr:response regulator [Pacificispira spongiicola]NMM46507.1 response regulator [Pacificispira spongiicola]
MPPASSLHAKLNILIAEDNEPSRRLLQGIVNGLGIHSVVAVSNGADALLELQEHRYDIAFVDVKMPIMDGFELAGLVRSGAAPTNTDIHFVFVTTQANQEAISQAQRIAASGYIVKPYTIAQVTAKLNSVAEAIANTRN